MTAGNLDFIVEKGAKFSKTLTLEYSNGTTRDLTGKTMKCVIKESTATDTILFTLTEANGGVEIIDATGGELAIHIDADDTNVAVDYGVYTLSEADDDALLTDIEYILKGKVIFEA